MCAYSVTFVSPYSLDHWAFGIFLICKIDGFPQFNQKYGQQLSDGSWQVPAPWQAGLSNVSLHICVFENVIDSNSPKGCQCGRNYWSIHQRMGVGAIWVPLHSDDLSDSDHRFHRYFLHRPISHRFASCRDPLRYCE